MQQPAKKAAVQHSFINYNSAENINEILILLYLFWMAMNLEHKEKKYHPFPWFVSVIRRKLTHTKKSAVITNPIMGKWTSDKSLQTVKSAQILLHA